jgi:hypothetical protein
VVSGRGLLSTSIVQQNQGVFEFFVLKWANVTLG